MNAGEPVGYDLGCGFCSGFGGLLVGELFGGGLLGLGGCGTYGEVVLRLGG
jgi:hypothetical protein